MHFSVQQQLSSLSLRPQLYTLLRESSIETFVIPNLASKLCYSQSSKFCYWFWFFYKWKQSSLGNNSFVFFRKIFNLKLNTFSGTITWKFIGFDSWIKPFFRKIKTLVQTILVHLDLQTHVWAQSPVSFVLWSAQSKIWFFWERHEIRMLLLCPYKRILILRNFKKFFSFRISRCRNPFPL